MSRDQTSKSLSIAERRTYLAEMVLLQGDTDYEMAHSNGDKLLCQILDRLGYSDITAEYEKITRHCA